MMYNITIFIKEYIPKKKKKKKKNIFQYQTTKCNNPKLQFFFYFCPNLINNKYFLKNK